LFGHLAHCYHRATRLNNAANPADLLALHRPDAIRVGHEAVSEKCPLQESLIVFLNPAYQPIGPLLVDGPAGESRGGCDCAA
jgi:hypothetical protein